MSSINRKLGLVALLLMVASFLTPLQMKAQTNYGSVRGLVKDSQGAVIPDAVVTLTNVGTKISRTSKTSNAGEYEFTSVNPGDYEVSVELKGFKTFKTATTVEVGDTATVDAAMQVGSAGETVEVQTSEPLIDTASASAGQNFTSQQLTELPNLGRNPFVFEKFDNNVTPVGDPRYVRAEDQSGSSSVSIAGAPIGSNSYVVDGIPVSTPSGGVTFIPSPEAVSSAKTQANTYDAEVGRTGGGVGNTSLKSGTTTYHGVLYGQTIQTNWTANSWANKHTNLLDSSGKPIVVNGVTQITPRPDVTTYKYAGAFGGPVPFFDKVKYLKNTFFFVTEEGYRQAQPLTGVGNQVVPTTAEAAGDFSADLVDPKNPLTLYDPTAGFAAGASGCTNTSCRTARLMGMKNGVPTPNVIPASYFNPIGSWIAANAYPTATASAGYGIYNAFRADDFKTRSDMYSGKLDHTFNQWISSNISYVHLATQEPSGDFYGNKANFSGDGKLVRFNDATSFYNVITINPTTIATVGYGFNRYYSVTFPYGLGFNLTSGFGGAGFPAGFLTNVQSHFGSQYTFPSISATTNTGSSAAYPSLGSGFGGRSIPSASHNFVFGIQKTVGNQNLKAGYVYRSMHVASDPNGSNPSFAFTGAYTSVDGKTSSSQHTGSGLADLEMGLPAGTSAASIGIDSGSFNERANYHALYFQDDFRANDKLTLNLGVRYEYELGQREAKNQMAVGFDPTVVYTNPTTGQIFHGGLAFAGQNGYPIHAANQSHSKFSPRIGVAYEFRKGTVLQAGFGIFYGPVNVVAYTPGYTQSSSFVPGSAGNIVSAITPAQMGSNTVLSNPFNGTTTGFLIPPSGNTLGTRTSLGSSISVVDFARRDPVVQQYSVRIEHQLPWATTLTVGYVGAHSKNFPQSVSIDQLSDGLFAQFAANAANGATTDYSKALSNNPYLFPTTSNGTTNYSTGSVTTNSTMPMGQALLPYPQYSGVTLSESTGYSLYNAGNIKVQKRTNKGLTLLFAYTLASNWDNLFGGGSSLAGTNGPADNYNLKKEYARASNDIPNRLTAAVSYVLPVGRGRQFFSGMPRLLDYVVGGYTVNAAIARQDGGPLSITQSTNYSTQFGVSGFGGTARPNLTGAGICYSGKPEDRIASHGSYFNDNTNPDGTLGGSLPFAGTRAFTYGNSPRSLPCKGPGLSNTDLNISKDFKVGERVTIRFVADALNVTNTPQFAISGTSLATCTNAVSASNPAGTNPGCPTAAPTVGTAPTLKGTLGSTGILSQINFNRLIQIGGRIFF